VPSGQTVPTVGQRVVLYEEDPSDPQGKRYTGSAIWRTETVSTKPGLAPELGVRADVTIPERRMAVTWSLRRSTDKGAPASYTIETTFNLPADLHGGGIANVPGMLMKQSEQARGTALAGLAVKVMNGFFVIGLSAADTDVQRNEQLVVRYSDRLHQRSTRDPRNGKGFAGRPYFRRGVCCLGKEMTENGVTCPQRGLGSRRSTRRMNVGDQRFDRNYPAALRKRRLSFAARNWASSVNSGTQHAPLPR